MIFKKILLTTTLILLWVKVGSSPMTKKVYTYFTPSNLLQTMESIGIKYPDIVMAQAKLETGNFTSKIFIENHNLFGMKLARQRETTAIGEQYNHARYISWVQSLMDYKLWQDKYASKFKTRRAYLAYLSENYAQDKKYIHKLKQML